MKTTWWRADIAPKISHDCRGLIYTCAAAYVRLNDEKSHIFQFSLRKMAPGVPRIHAIST